MANEAGNIIVGVGTLSVDEHDVGLTQDGVQMARETEYLDITSDQHTATLKKYLTSERRYIRTSLLEATLANLQLVWGGELDDGGGTGDITLSMSSQSGAATEHKITFVGPAPDGYTQRMYTHNRAVQIGTGEHSYTKDGAVTIPVEFEILADLDSPGSEWGTIVDKVQA